MYHINLDLFKRKQSKKYRRNFWLVVSVDRHLVNLSRPGSKKDNPCDDGYLCNVEATSRGLFSSEEIKVQKAGVNLFNFFLLSFFFLFGITMTLEAQTATEIIKRANERMQGESSKAEMTMQIVRPNWERSVSFKSWSKGDDYSLILITAPARDEGTAFLMRENEIWNWLPDVNRTIKMPPSLLSQSWMGSDFSNNDLVRESSIVTDYTYKLLQDTTISGYDSYRIEMIPKPEAPIVWAKVHTYISKEDYLQLRSEFYDEDDYLMRILNGLEVKELGGRIIPTKLEMIPVEEDGNKTIVTYQNLEFNIDISERFFSIQNMKRIQ